MTKLKPSITFTLATLVLLCGCQTMGSRPNDEVLNKRIESHYALGLDALRKGNLPKAFDELLYVERLAPERPDILAALAYAWQLRGNYGKAQAYYERALQHNPPASVYNNYGGLQLLLNRPREAEKYFRKALDDPRYRHPDIAYINLGDALLAQGRLDAAVAAYRQAKILNPLQELSRLKEAGAYVRFGRNGYARAMYETILREHPGDKRALAALLPLLVKSGDTAAARNQLEIFLAHTSSPTDRAWAQEALRGLQP